MNCMRANAHLSWTASTVESENEDLQLAGLGKETMEVRSRYYPFILRLCRIWHEWSRLMRMGCKCWQIICGAWIFGLDSLSDFILLCIDASGLARVCRWHGYEQRGPIPCMSRDPKNKRYLVTQLGIWTMNSQSLWYVPQHHRGYTRRFRT